MTFRSFSSSSLGYFRYRCLTKKYAKGLLRHHNNKNKCIHSTSSHHTCPYQRLQLVKVCPIFLGTCVSI